MSKRNFEIENSVITKNKKSKKTTITEGKIIKGEKNKPSSSIPTKPEAQDPHQKSKNIPNELIKKMRSIDVIPIDKDAILAVHIDITNMLPRDVDSYIEKMRVLLDTFFKKYDMPYMIIVERGRETVKFESISKIKK